MSKQPPICRECQKKVAGAAWGLCDGCYRNKEVRAKWKAVDGADEEIQRRKNSRPQHPTTEMTEAQLDELIAEQSKPENLPWHWHADAFRHLQTRHKDD